MMGHLRRLLKRTISVLSALIGLLVITASTPALSAEVFSEGLRSENGFWGFDIKEIRTIYVEGEIEFGDLDKIQKEVKKGFVFSINFWSRGGNLDEALRISDFLNEKKIGLRAPYYNGVTKPCDGTVDKLRPRSQENCNCASACAVIWLLAPFRSGNIVGLHRPRFEEKYFANLKPDEAKKTYDKLILNLKEKLSSSQVDQKLIEKNFSTPSDSIYYLSEQEIGQAGNEAPFLHEYINAKCAAFIPEKQKYDSLGKQIKNLLAKQDKLLSKAEWTQEEVVYSNKLLSEITRLQSLQVPSLTDGWDTCSSKAKIQIQFEAQR